MLKLLSLLILGVGASVAQTTTVAQTILNPDGTQATGQVAFRIAAACNTPAGTYVGDKTITIHFTNGAFSVALAPNDTCLPASTYGATWLLSGGHSWEETWFVPTSSSPLRVSSVVIPSIPAPSIFISPPQIMAAGLSNGSYCLSVANGVVSGLVTCASGTTNPFAGQTWRQLTASVWSQMTTYTWSQMQ
jgi:hypothetical protein